MAKLVYGLTSSAAYTTPNPYKDIDVAKLTTAQLGAIIGQPGGVMYSHLYNLQQNALFESQRRGEEARRKKTTARRQQLRSRAVEMLKIANAGRPTSLGRLSGIAIPSGVWGRPTAMDCGMLEREIVDSSAFDDLLNSPQEVKLLIDHRSSHLVARRSDFTLKLNKTPGGLFITADVPATEMGEHVAGLLDTGRIAGFSFWIMFEGSKYRTETVGGCRLRHFSRLSISEISLITRPGVPAYPLVSPIQWRRKPV